jgi:flagellar biosynthesis protein FlhA
MLLDRLGPEYKRLVDDICPSQISYSGLLAVLKLLLAERVSIRNLHLILEAIAEVAPHARRAELIAEHVRMRIAQQICGDLTLMLETHLKQNSPVRSDATRPRP